MTDGQTGLKTCCHDQEIENERKIKVAAVGMESDERELWQLKCIVLDWT